jgi:hypothetical protein
MTEAWYRISTYNTQALYGFGTEAEAEKYVDILNEGRDMNIYSAERLTSEEAAELRLEDNTEAFNLDDELAAREGKR